MRTDDFLRAKGYRVFSRPVGAEPIWELPGVHIVPESVAVAYVTRWERDHRPRANLGYRTDDVAAILIGFFVAVILLLIAAVAHGKPDRPADPPKKAEPMLTFQTQYGAMEQRGKAVAIDGPHWTATGMIRDDGSIFLLWTEIGTGRVAPSVYRIEAGRPVGLWGFAPDAFVDDSGKMSGDLRPDRLDRVEPAPMPID